MPLVILLAIMMAGMLLPSTSLIGEKQKKTLTALTTTPATLLEVVLSKGLLGFIVSMVIALIVLVMNNMTGVRIVLLVFVLTLGAVLSTVIGLFFGVLAKDINTLMTIVKSIMLFFYTPAILKIFPEIPDWVGRLFPTYYILEPVLSITQKNSGFYDIAPDFFILAGIILCLTGILVVMMNRRIKVSV
jgi:ABC-2 type transport system permease protein